MDFDKKYAFQKEKVAYRVVNDGAVILNLENGCYYGLNIIGTQIWQGIEKGKSLGEIAGLISEEYPVSEHQIRADLVKLVTDLEKEGLITQ